MSAGTIIALPQLFAAMQRIEHELLLFAAFWFIIGAIDELAIDLGWIWLRLTGRAKTTKLPAEYESRPIRVSAAVMVPAWHEADVIGAMIAHTLKVWPQPNVTLYVGCYCNDPDTVAAAMAGAGGDPRLRLVIHDREGPTTKADCLNRLYAALCDDEARSDRRYSTVILHDSEDMVHPAALQLICGALATVDFVQLPVRPEPQPDSPWIAGHYSDEFTEAHAKALVVRDALGAAIPAAGVGCGFSRAALGRLAATRSAAGGVGPFEPESLTEDYELGLLVSRGGQSGRFLRVRDSFGELVATRAFFPASRDEAVRQKTRWIHGIAFQAWDRMGWSGRPIDIWMALRDRRGPLTALVLASAYLLLVIEAILGIARFGGWLETVAISPVLRLMLAISFASFVWRATWRFGFTAREYGIAEGIRSILRIPIANIIAIMAGRRALVAYVGTLRGVDARWDKTRHYDHPAAIRSDAVAR